MVLKVNNAKSEVGPGKPPKHSQFKPGQSGNPKGRPKGSKNITKLLEKELNKLITVTENGKQRKISIAEAIARRLVTDSAKGNARSLELLLKTMSALGQNEDLTGQTSDIGVPDAKALARIQDRLAKLVSQGVGDETATQ